MDSDFHAHLPSVRFGSVRFCTHPRYRREELLAAAADAAAAAAPATNANSTITDDDGTPRPTTPPSNGLGLNNAWAAQVLRDHPDLLGITLRDICYDGADLLGAR